MARATLILYARTTDSVALTALGNLAAARDAGHEVILITPSEMLNHSRGKLVHRVLNSLGEPAPSLHHATLTATGEALVFLNPDLRMDRECIDFLGELARADPAWGWFELIPEKCPHPAIAKALNSWAKYSRMPEPELGLFVHRHLLNAVGGLQQNESHPLRRVIKRLQPRILPQSSLPPARSELADFAKSPGLQLYRRRLARLFAAGPAF